MANKGDAGKSVVLVKNKKALFRVVVAEIPGTPYEPEGKRSRYPIDGLHLAAADLASYTRKSTGAEPEVLVNQTKDDGLVHLHVGMTDYVKGLGLDFPKPQGSVVEFPDQKNIVIAGIPLESYEANTRDGVASFLRTYLGVRWLLPGEMGEHVPKRSTWTVPVKNVRKVPSFFLRQASGYGKVFRGEERWGPVRWSRRMGYLSGAGLRFSHNIGNIIDPEKCGETHPEFFPFIDGKRLVPDAKMKHRKGYVHGWEPCYTADGLVDEAAKNIVEFFDSNPTAYSYSLGINDGAHICECEKCRDRNKGFPEWCQSQSYYEWANAVVKKVRRKYQDRYFGLLAYSRVSPPPKGIVLDDHIVPILAWETRYFADPMAGKRKSEEHVDAWSKAAPTFGWWDYTFEGSYFIPAFYARHLDRTLKRLYTKGLRFYQDEVHPGKYFKNAPQEYLRCRLRWDISLDADALLSEWYELAVGKEAAPYMAKYFAIWEDYWTTRVIKTDWYRQRIDGEFVAPFLQRRECGYLDVLTREDVLEAERLLAKTVELAGTEKQKQRAKFFHDYFAMAKSRLILPYLAHAEMTRNRPQAKTARSLFHDDFDKPRPGKNPRFQGWGSWKRAFSKARSFHDETEGHTGTGSLCFHNEDSLPSPLAFTNNLPFDRFVPGRTYKVACWCKTNVDAVSRVRLYVQFLRKSGGPLGSVRGSKGKLELDDRDYGCAKEQWEERCIYLTVPQAGWDDVGQIRCVLAILGDAAQVGCKTWFDDFSIVEIESAE